MKIMRFFELHESSVNSRDLRGLCILIDIFVDVDLTLQGSY